MCVLFECEFFKSTRREKYIKILTLEIYNLKQNDTRGAILLLAFRRLYDNNK